MNIIVTGINSEISLNLIKILLANNINVIGLYRNKLSKGIFELKQTKNIKLYDFDLSKYENYNILPKNIDLIVHIAAVSNYLGVSNEIIIDSNIIATNNLLKFAKINNVPRIIYTSSISIHGEVLKKIVNNKTPIFKPNFYGASKYLSEVSIETFSDSISAICLRLPGVLGIKNPNILISKICNQLLKNEDITLYNSSNYFNNGIHVKDLASFIYTLITNNGWKGFNSFPISSCNPIKLIDLIKELKIKLNSNSKIISINNRRKSFIIDSDYASKLFLYKPRPILDSCKMHCDFLLS
jgi:nucleoside-diphosphate-sugar epimerase